MDVDCNSKPRKHKASWYRDTVEKAHIVNKIYAEQNLWERSAAGKSEKATLVKDGDQSPVKKLGQTTMEMVEVISALRDLLGAMPISCY